MLGRAFETGSALPLSSATASQRREERVSLFVMAALHASEGGAPVKLRNISPGGALVEGDDLPGRGARIELRKGSLAVPGAVVWRNANRAGLSFSRETDVAGWLPSAQAQKSVDRTFQRLKTAQSFPFSECDAGAPLHSSAVSAENLHRTAAALDDLADALALDGAVVTRFAGRLQALDVAAQLLRKLGANAVYPSEPG